MEVPLSPDCPIQLDYYLQHAQWTAFFTTALFLAYLFYYRLYVVAPPQVVCADVASLAALREHCPALFERYWPTPWASPAYMQTVLRAVIQTYPKPRRRRYVPSMCLDNIPPSYVPS